MEREEVIQDLHRQIESLARLHIHRGLYNTEGYIRSRDRIRQTISEYSIDVRRELDPVVGLLYHRYFS